jgi:hypothetical protein
MATHLHDALEGRNCRFAPEAVQYVSHTYVNVCETAALPHVVCPKS